MVEEGSETQPGGGPADQEGAGSADDGLSPEAEVSIDLKGLVEFLARNLVTHPDSVEVSLAETDEANALELRVHKDDLGRVIGKQGRTAKSLRTILNAAASRANTGPYIVFFDWDESVITAEAATILDSAVTAYANCGTANVMLAGHTDRSGSVTYNMGLAERRNASVTEYLTGRGIPAGRISGEAFGEAQPRVATADGVRELQNRRVEVTYGPGSGM